MPPPKVEPEWVQPFLAELARTGNVTASAEVAGVDRTNAQARRKRVPAFAAAWDIALAEYRAGRSFQRGLSASGDEARAHAGGAKMMRVGSGRWSKAAEERFLIELGTSGKVRRAAAAAGFSEEAICRRRRKEPQFAEACDMAIEEGKARVEALLVAWSERSFDPDAVPMAADGAMPKVTVSEAIKIVQSRPSTRLRMSGGKKHADPFFDGWEEDAAEHDAAMERIVGKLERLGEREDAKKAEAGWTRCHVHDTWVPPGWGILAKVRLRPLQLPPEAADATFSPSVDEVEEARPCPHCEERIGLTFGAPSA